MGRGDGAQLLNSADKLRGPAFTLLVAHWAAVHAVGILKCRPEALHTSNRPADIFRLRLLQGKLDNSLPERSYHVDVQRERLECECILLVGLASSLRGQHWLENIKRTEIRGRACKPLRDSVNHRIVECRW